MAVKAKVEIGKMSHLDSNEIIRFLREVEECRGWVDPLTQSVVDLIKERLKHCDGRHRPTSGVVHPATNVDAEHE